MQQVESTPQAISGLQFHVFIRNRSRGANVAYPKLLHGGKGGRCSGAAVQRCSGAAVQRCSGGSVTQVTRVTPFAIGSCGAPESKQGATCSIVPGVEDGFCGKKR